MKKILVIGALCLVLVSCVYLFTILSPQPSLVFETIKPQIICYGGLC